MAQKYGITPEKLYDPEEAKAIHKLLRKHIKRRLKELPGLNDKVFNNLKKKHPGLNKKELFKLLRKDDYDIYRTLKDLGDEQKALRRGLAELLTTDPNFFDKKGLLDIFSTDLDNLKGSKLASTLKNWDGYLSGYKLKTGKVGHHQTLSSLTDMLSKVDEDWRGKFNTLAKEHGFQIGDEGLEFMTPGAHKPFSTVKGKPHIKVIKGDLAEKLSKFMPEAWDSKKKVLLVEDGINPKIDKILNKLETISSHSKGYGGTQGYAVLDRLADKSPEDAFNVARNTLGAEKQIAYQGKKVSDKLGIHLKKDASSTLDEFTDSLSSRLDKPDFQPESIKSLVNEPMSKPMQGPGVDKRAVADWEASRMSAADGIKIKNAPVEPKGGILRIVKKGVKTGLKGNLLQKAMISPLRAAGTPLGGGEQGEALGNLARTGDTKYVKDLAIASGKDLAIGGAFGVGTKALAQRQLTKSLITKGLARTALGTVAGPVGWALLGYSAVDTANAFTKAYTGKGFVGHAKELFIKNQDDPAKGVQIASN